MNWQDIPIPRRMRALQRDQRGYPIPFIILRDTDQRPHFTINDTSRVHKCVLESRCPICGNRLDKVKWFVGGPLSAFHERGSYFDSAMHHDCMTYALQVCPYLAMPNYLGRIDTATMKPEKVPEGVHMFMDTTMIPERPTLFVAVGSHQQIATLSPAGFQFGMYNVRPGKPYLEVEYWRNGQRLAEDTGAELVRLALERGVGL